MCSCPGEGWWDVGSPPNREGVNREASESGCRAPVLSEELQLLPSPRGRRAARPQVAVAPPAAAVPAGGWLFADGFHFCFMSRVEMSSTSASPRRAKSPGGKQGRPSLGLVLPRGHKADLVSGWWGCPGCCELGVTGRGGSVARRPESFSLNTRS